jgi:long-chain acyl-CoA synthetase
MLATLLQRNADADATSVAIVFGNERWTHGELLGRVQRLAQGLAESGIGRGDRIAIFQANSPDYIACFFAIAACGATVVPISPECKAEELKFYLDDADVRSVIADAARIELTRSVIDSSNREIALISSGTTAPGLRTLTELMDNDGSHPLGYGELNDDVIFLYSSGSTGRPKCVPRTVIQYWWEADIQAAMLELSAGDVIFCAIPLFHNYGIVECMLAAAFSRARLVILPSPAPLKLLEQERATIFPAVPFLFKHLLDSSAPADLSSLRYCYTAAAVLPRETFDGFLAAYGVPIRQHYGCAEVGALTINTDPDPKPSFQSVGRPYPGVRVRVVDEHDRDVPVGESGEVIVASRAMTRGYLGMGDLNDTAFRGGFFRTGDLGRFDDEGRLYLLGRKKFVIDVAGHKVDPVEVEDTLAQHDAVAEAVVIGLPDPDAGDNTVSAYVVATARCERTELIAFCRERLANFKVPRSIEFIRSVPRDDLGKIVRKQEVLTRYVVTDHE